MPRPKKVITIDEQIKTQEAAVAAAKAKYEEVTVTAKAKYDETVAKAQAVYDNAVTRAETRYTEAEAKLEELKKIREDELREKALDVIMSSGLSIDEVIKRLGVESDLREDTLSVVE